MAKVRIINYFNGMPVTAKPGDEIELDDRYVEGLAKTGYVALIKPKVFQEPSDEVVTRPRRGGR